MILCGEGGYIESFLLEETFKIILQGGGGGGGGGRGKGIVFRPLLT